MAKVSETSITKTDALNHLRSAKAMSELTCEKIIGFHLVKTQKGATWRLRYTDFSGARRKVSLGKFVDGTADRIDSAQLARKYRDDLKAGNDPVENIRLKKRNFAEQQATKHQRLFRTYLDEVYTPYQMTKRGGKKTLATLNSAFKELESLPMDEITVTDLNAWCKRYSVDRAVTTVERTYTALRAMLYHAKESGVISKLQNKGFKIPKRTSQETDAELSSEELAKRRMLTEEEIVGIKKGLDSYKIEVGESHWFFPFFRLAEYSGMRPGDLYSMTWQELNLNFKVIRKHPNKTRHHNNPVEVVLPLDDDILNLMREWYQFIGSPQKGLVFPSPKTGREITNTMHLGHWKKVLALGGLKENLDFYALRHNFISKLLQANVPLSTVAKLAGHKTTKMIEKHYHHMLPKAAAEALSMIAGDFSKPNNLEVKAK
ncbi:integrase family protein [Aliiglaciecola sp. 3_MG-2023]|uniref:integrase family protein n=1 Tax=Aliiglaciecola sp. 3_MG-2023 TaxID=3062644 RepID=UPI0026E489E8|nr:integrase family protein [Aliiglaciecola sp. 3_MG-2023]MDO6691799.1 integrase family protein [Aliiglaciecola sp. 3_MG-2023]